jgi:hypothetical protein
MTKNAGPKGPAQYVDASPSTNTFQRGTAGGTPVCHLGGNAHRHAYSSGKFATGSGVTQCNKSHASHATTASHLAQGVVAV